MKYKVIGPVSETATYSSFLSAFKETDCILSTRTYLRWYEKNKKIISKLAGATSLVAYTLFRPTLALAAGSTGGFGFFAGHGVILLHMLIVGFLTLIVTTFLKFTGRGDLAPLVVFVGGGVILYEVIQLFNAIYQAIATFLKM